jgi:hypothetical protein
MYVYRSKDRRMIESSYELLHAIIARDLRAANPKKTSSISTRALILDTNNTPGGLLYAANQIVTHMLNLLTLQTS